MESNIILGFSSLLIYIFFFDWLQIGLSSTAIASSFGKAMSDSKEREDYKPEDIARSLLRMISNNIGQVSFSLWICS
jgi:pantothenate kinase